MIEKYGPESLANGMYYRRKRHLPRNDGSLKSGRLNSDASSPNNKLKPPPQLQQEKRTLSPEEKKQLRKEKMKARLLKIS